MTLDVINHKGEIVAALDIEGATASRSELEVHYTQFARMFLKHLGRNLKVVARSNNRRPS